MKKNILVTGGAGYIGSHIVQLLCDEGHSVSVFDNFSLGLRENIDPRVTNVVEGDLLKKSDLERAFETSIDVVFHFAAWKAAGESMIKPEKYSTNNITGTLNLLNMMVEKEVNYIVFSSSAAVYGDPKYLPIDEKHPLNPTNYYGYTKLCIEQNLEWYSRLKGINYSALRYFNATGYDVNEKIKGKEQNPANLSPIIMEVIAGERNKIDVYGNDYDTKDGTCIRDYIHVTDLAIAHLLSMNYILENDKNLVVNLGSEVGHSVLEVINTASKVIGKEVRYKTTARREGDPAELVASSRLAKEILSWEPKHSDLETIFYSMSKVYLKA
jgi:UDP-glucose 4-epimerase